MKKMTNHFEKLAAIDVSEHVERKGNFSYLSWAWAVDQLRRHDPSATWEVKRFDGMPYMKTELGYFVEVEVTSNGIGMSQIHPVLDNRNKPIAKPTPFDINTSIQRCLVKAIALHGLGLYIYAGEDLPKVEEEKPSEKLMDNIKTTAFELSQLRNTDPATVFESMNIKNLSQLNKEQAEKALAVLEKWFKQAQEKIMNEQK
ncbi:phage-related protein [Shouchella clausii KSM-K16]|uniref:Phage-related protein n=1 Tax=Shouchella clausii (strain KSM-K16) TaxID=66692 RepID=Q5WE14_SHOC1|nr:phage-related protein [Shouchella clausii KSM-K16]